MQFRPWPVELGKGSMVEICAFNKGDKFSMLFHCKFYIWCYCDDSSPFAWQLTGKFKNIQISKGN